MSTTSSHVGPGMLLPCRYIGEPICTKGRGTTSVKPPVVDWISLINLK